jgi:hypothetical protein
LIHSSKRSYNCLTSFAQHGDVHLPITDSRLPGGKAKTLEAVGQNSMTERDADLRAGSLQPFAGSTRQSRIRQKKSWINSRRIETIINSARENYPGSL